MKLFTLLSFSSMLLMLMSACSKSTSNNTPAPVVTTPVSNITTVGNTTNYNGYIVKTIGISRIVLSVDDNTKLTFAYLYGGGNKIILKPGSSNTIETKFASVATNPDRVSSKPDGQVSYLDQEIDNGKVLDTSAFKAGTIKIRGFDKSKTGYDQLNIVMSGWLWPSYISGGYYSNVTYLKMKEATGKVNADYSGLLYQLLSGPISVSSIELAPPLSNSTYVIEDQIVSLGQSVYDPLIPRIYNVNLTRLGYGYNSNYMGVPGSYNTYKLSWVNADAGTVTALDAYSFSLKFNNMKVGGLDQIVEPSDTTSRPFLRITGFDRKYFGFNQLRLFIANDGFYDGGLQVIFSQKQTSIPALATMKSVYTTPNLYCLGAAPIWPHY